MEIRDILSRVFRLAAQAGVLQRFCRSKADGVCRLPFYRFIFLLFYLFTVLPLFVSCSGGDDADSPQAPTTDNLQTVRLYLNVPSTQTSRAIGDPGEATGEGDKWDRLAVMIESADDENIVQGSKYYVEILEREEFEHLDKDNNGYHWLPIELIEGSKVYIYGVTYNSDASGNPENEIKSIRDQISGSFANLEISNNYSADENGNIDVAKFLSVATGYYEENNSREFTVKQPDGGIMDRTNMPTMRLTRLAAKIDIQWDAEDAYPNYTDVRVTNFKFYYNKDATDLSQDNNGVLFPAICKDTGNSHGYKLFYNISEISQHNGRVYHYVFPDGSSRPQVTFHLSAKSSENGTTVVDDDYTFTFDKKLEKATWYKINTMIRGFSGSTEIEISPDATGASTTTN